MNPEGSIVASRYCAVVPTYDNPETVARVAAALANEVETVFVVDDGSGPVAREVCAALHAPPRIQTVRRDRNGGKGAAVLTGLDVARQAGFTHALQADADGQHDLSRAAAFIETSRREPRALILGHPVYDESAPRVRRSAREITRFWVDIETGRGTITDAMVGFRVYPVAATLGLPVAGRRMDFDVEVAVRFAWSGQPIVNLPVGVRYLSAEEGGRSHFQPIRDNIRLAWMHSRLCTIGATLWCLRKLGLVR